MLYLANALIKTNQKEEAKEVLKKIIGTDVNSSNVSAIVEDTTTKKIRNIYEH